MPADATRVGSPCRPLPYAAPLNSAPMGASLRTGLPLLGICPASWTNCPRKIAQVQVDRIFAKQPENAVRGATQLQELPSELSFDNSSRLGVRKIKDARVKKTFGLRTRLESVLPIPYSVLSPASLFPSLHALRAASQVQCAAQIPTCTLMGPGLNRVGCETSPKLRGYGPVNSRGPYPPRVATTPDRPRRSDTTARSRSPRTASPASRECTCSTAPP